MSKTSLKLDNHWQGSWPEFVDVVSPDSEEHINYVPLMPWDGKRYHCIYCGAELHGYQRRCSCGKKIYGYENNGHRAVLDTPEQAIAATLGHGTCHIREHKGEWNCDACNNVVASSDPTDELYTSGNAIELWEFCPYCGARVVR